MISTSDFKNGKSIEMEGVLYVIVEFQHVKPGKGGAFVRTRLKNIKTGLVRDMTFKAGEKFQDAHVEDRAMQYLYKDSEGYCFMDQQSYEQYHLSPEFIGDAKDLLLENMECYVKMYNENTPIGIELPNFIYMVVVECEPAVKGDTVNNVMKKAKLVTGYEIGVPLFINQGEKIRIDTRTREYIGRG
ncbi:MAG: elongation factor P [Candidatus Wallbacteria bacterium]|nr:elongation factor P [Candidatus Wallbacteria bacterium]